MKLGKKPASNAVKFAFSAYADTKALPKPPKTFGHEDLIDSKMWSMLGNDQYGDCVWAGAAHETMMWNKEASKSISFTDKSVLSDYTAVTGFDPLKPDTDQGTDMAEAASYRRKTGVVDASGNRHKIAAYLAIKPGNLTELYQAMWLFGAVGVGIQFPSTAMDQFNKGKPWSVVSKSSIEGGHYIPLVAKRTRLECVTWGQLQGMTTGFFTKYCDEAIAYLTDEDLINGKSPELFDYAALQKDLNALPKA